MKKGKEKEKKKTVPGQRCWAICRNISQWLTFTSGSPGMMESPTLMDEAVAFSLSAFSLAVAVASGLTGEEDGGADERFRVHREADTGHAEGITEVGRIPSNGVVLLSKEEAKGPVCALTGNALRTAVGDAEMRPSKGRNPRT